MMNSPKRTIAKVLLCTLVLFIAFWGGDRTARGQTRPSPRPQSEVTKEQFERWMVELSNWGRWGKDDQLGAANLITAEKRKQAATLVRNGTSVSLAHDVIAQKAGEPPNSGMGRMAPFIGVLRTQMLVDTDYQNALDRWDIAAHGGTFTHLDALCHVAYKGKLYNGFDLLETVTTDGCSKMGITALKDGLVTRGVLLDIPRLRNVPYLEPSMSVTRQDVEDWERYAGVRVKSGDALFLRTGRWTRQDQGESAGWDNSLMPFLKERDVAVLGADSANGSKPIPGVTLPSGRSYPIFHRFAIVARGMSLLDNVDLEAAAETAARLKRWEFMLVVAPVRVSGGTGSPINPIAVF